MKIKFITLFVATLYGFLPAAYTQTVSKLNSRGEITFKIKNAGIDVTGTIDIIDLQIVFDEKNLAQSQVVASADPNKINTGIEIRDNHLRRRDYFDVIHYPTITLQSKTFKKVNKHFEGQFDLTIKNIKKVVVVDFRRKEKEDMVIFEGSFAIDRMDFDLGRESNILDELVTVCFTVVCEQ